MTKTVGYVCDENDRISSYILVHILFSLFVVALLVIDADTNVAIIL